jgi:hypothetical protein
MTRLRGVPAVLHQSRTLSADDVLPTAPPRTRVERAAIDGAAWSRPPRTAVGLLAAVVQQRLTTARRLQVALDAAGPVRHAALCRAVLTDIDGGALHMVAERWWRDMERENELKLVGTAVLRFPSLAVRLHPERVADQLRRALGLA